MKTKISFIFKVFALFCISLVLLASCKKPAESPEEVIQKFKEQVTEIKSGDISADVSMNGADDQDTIDFTADMNFKFDRNDDQSKKADIKVALTGTLKTDEQSLDGDIDFNVRTIGSDYYILLDKLDSSDENMQAVKPYLEKYIGNWLHISDDFIPENIRQLQEKDEATLEKEEQLKQLFVNTKLFNVIKEYGVETLNGKKVYHYGVQFNEEGIKDYIRQVAIMDGRELTEAEIEEASKIVSYMTNGELWIGADDYYLYKAVANFTAGAGEGEADMNISITIIGAGYNSSVKITAPADAEEFNPLELLMVYSTANMDNGEMPALEEGAE